MSDTNAPQQPTEPTQPEDITGTEQSATESADTSAQQPVVPPVVPPVQQSQYAQPAQPQQYSQAPQYAQPQQYAQAPQYAQYAQPGYPQAPQQRQLVQGSKSKVVAGILGILLGSLGVHNFYLGHTGRAVAQLLISVLSLGILAIASSIWGLVEGILILCSKPGTSWHQDSSGHELTD